MTKDEQREKNVALLFTLLKLKKKSPGIDDTALHEAILEAQAPMSVEDISHVEKLISKL